MRALRFEKTGSLDDLGIRELPIPTPAAGEVLVQVKAAAVNPSDVKNVEGKMHETSVPRTPGRDFAGVVARGSDELSGQSVFGSGGNPVSVAMEATQSMSRFQRMRFCLCRGT
jgi:NADPH:quinone reductase